MSAGITEERIAEVRGLLARTRECVARRPDTVAAGLAGSWARSDPRMDSDVDLILLTTLENLYLEDDAWIRKLGGAQVVRTNRWGPMTERRFVLSSGLEVEAGIASPSWASTDPLDPNLIPLTRAGFHILHDPDGILTRLLAACGAVDKEAP